MIVGTATFTIVLSSTMMNSELERTTRASQRFGSGGAVLCQAGAVTRSPIGGATGHLSPQDGVEHVGSEGGPGDVGQVGEAAERVPAVDGGDLAGDRLRLGAGKAADGGGDVVGLAQA